MFASRRAGRATFWYLAADRLVAAVIARTSDEPLLEACAASYAQRGPACLFAPGIVELAWLLGAEQFGHVAALAAPFCTIDAPGNNGAGSGTNLTPSCGEPIVADGFGGAGAAANAPNAQERVATIRGIHRGSGNPASARYTGLRVRAQLQAVSRAQGLFRRARLRLLALDCEACALVTLADTLGTSSPALWPDAIVSSLGATAGATAALGAQATAAAVSPQPLAAVSVSPEAERAAHALGDDLAVPVGLALAWFGAPRAR